MAGPNFIFNVAKGRGAELFYRVDISDPAAGVLVMCVLAETGLESDDVLQDADTFAAVIAGTTNEVTNVGYSRQELGTAQITWPGPDDGNDRIQLDIPDRNFGAISSGDTWKKVVVCYDPNAAGGTDSELIPITAHSINVIPDGSQVVISFPSDWYRAA